eukprot:3468997-Ditylum_brightwellii.AAC.1
MGKWNSLPVTMSNLLIFVRGTGAEFQAYVSNWIASVDTFTVSCSMMMTASPALRKQKKHSGRIILWLPPEATC